MSSYISRTSLDPQRTQPPRDVSAIRVTNVDQMTIHAGNVRVPKRAESKRGKEKPKWLKFMKRGRSKRPHSRGKSRRDDASVDLDNSSDRSSLYSARSYRRERRRRSRRSRRHAPRMSRRSRRTHSSSSSPDIPEGQAHSQRRSVVTFMRIKTVRDSRTGPDVPWSSENDTSPSTGGSIPRSSSPRHLSEASVRQNASWQPSNEPTYPPEPRRQDAECQWACCSSQAPPPNTRLPLAQTQWAQTGTSTSYAARPQYLGHRPPYIATNNTYTTTPAPSVQISDWAQTSSPDVQNAGPPIPRSYAPQRNWGQNNYQATDWTQTSNYVPHQYINTIRPVRPYSEPQLYAETDMNSSANYDSRMLTPSKYRYDSQRQSSAYVQVPRQTQVSTWETSTNYIPIRRTLTPNMYRQNYAQNYDAPQAPHQLQNSHWTQTASYEPSQNMNFPASAQLICCSGRSCSDPSLCPTNPQVFPRSYARGPDMRRDYGQTASSQAPPPLQLTDWTQTSNYSMYGTQTPISAPPPHMGPPARPPFNVYPQSQSSQTCDYTLPPVGPIPPQRPLPLQPVCPHKCCLCNVTAPGHGPFLAYSFAGYGRARQPNAQLPTLSSSSSSSSQRPSLYDNTEQWRVHVQECPGLPATHSYLVAPLAAEADEAAEEAAAREAAHSLSPELRVEGRPDAAVVECRRDAPACMRLFAREADVLGPTLPVPRGNRSTREGSQAPSLKVRVTLEAQEPVSPPSPTGPPDPPAPPRRSRASSRFLQPRDSIMVRHSQVRRMSQRTDDDDDDGPAIDPSTGTKRTSAVSFSEPQRDQ